MRGRTRGFAPWRTMRTLRPARSRTHQNRTPADRDRPRQRAHASSSANDIRSCRQCLAARDLDARDSRTTPMKSAARRRRRWRARRPEAPPHGPAGHGDAEQERRSHDAPADLVRQPAAQRRGDAAGDRCQRHEIGDQRHRHVEIAGNFEQQRRARRAARGRGEGGEACRGDQCPWHCALDLQVNAGVHVGGTVTAGPAPCYDIRMRIWIALFAMAAFALPVSAQQRTRLQVYSTLEVEKSTTSRRFRPRTATSKSCGCAIGRASLPPDPGRAGCSAATRSGAGRHLDDEAEGARHARALPRQRTLTPLPSFRDPSPPS